MGVSNLGGISGLLKSVKPKQLRYPVLQSDGNLPGANPINGIEKAKGMLESLFYTDSGALKT